MSNPIYDAQNARYSLEERILDSHNSVDSCLLDIVTSAKEKKEATVIQPPLMRQLVFLICVYTFGWALAWTAVVKETENSFKTEQVYALVIMAATGPGLSAFVVQFFYDGGLDGLTKLCKRCHPNMITKPWWVGSFLLIPCTLAVMSGVYVWFGGDPPPETNFTTFINFFLASLPIAIGEEFGWRGMMLPETQNVIDGWYFAAYGCTKNNDGRPFWESMYDDDGTNDNLTANSLAMEPTSRESQSAARGGSLSASMNARLMNTLVEADDEDASDAASIIIEDMNPHEPPHWKWSPTIASMFIGVVWGTWYLPAFFIQALHHKYCNFAQYVFEQMFLSMFYTWQSNNTKGSILAAIITHCLQQTFRSLNPWGTEQDPGFFKMPNALYQFELLILCISLIWVVGPELGREYNKHIYRKIR